MYRLIERLVDALNWSSNPWKLEGSRMKDSASATACLHIGVVLAGRGAGAFVVDDALAQRVGGEVGVEVLGYLTDDLTSADTSQDCLPATYRRAVTEPSRSASWRPRSNDLAFELCTISDVENKACFSYN